MSLIVHDQWKGSLDMGLAPRELEFTLMVAAGMTGKEIARVAGLAPDSVKKRISNAMYKLRAGNRAQLVGEAMKRGIIAPLVMILALGGISFTASPQPPRTPQRPVRVAMVRRIESVTV